jgi:hypothetical protein
MSELITLRVPPETAARLRARARRTDRSISEVGGRAIEEWLRQHEFPHIEFREISGERVACLKGHLELWQFIMIARELDLDATATAVHFQWPEWRARAALDYYAAYPDEIDRAIAENQSVTPLRLRQQLPMVAEFVASRGAIAEPTRE